MDKKNSPLLFNDISNTYDLINRILSFGIDQSWRKKLSRNLAQHQPKSVLDLACGTGDLMLSLYRHCPSIKALYGLDPAHKMIDLAKAKPKLKEAQFFIEYAENAPFIDSLDAVTMSFGLRNVEEPKKVFEKTLSLLNDGGRFFILEFSLPKNPIIKNLYLFYLRYILPTIGGWISRKKYAYQYLNATIETFPSRESLCQDLLDSGFKQATYHEMTFGTVCLYEAVK